MVRGVCAGWGTCSRTVTLNGDPQALSYGNNTIAIGLGLISDNIIILDAITGSQAAVLSSHTDWVRSLVFSSDGGLLVSGSDDKTVKLWDVQTGGVVKTFHGHTSHVLSVSISADAARIVSGSGDKTVCLWGIQTGECYHSIQLEDYTSYVGFFSTNPRSIVTISGDRVQWWGGVGYKTGPTYSASHIAFSPDHTLFALCSGNAVIVQNSRSRVVVADLHLPDGNPALYCCFSPQGNLVAVASKKMAYVWNIASSVPDLVATFSGHFNDITSLVFSSPSSLISASEDRSVKFWQIGVSSVDQAATDLKPTLSTSASIEFVSLQAEDGVAISGHSDGVVQIWDILTGLCKTSFQTPARETFQGDAQLINDRLLFIWGWKGRIHIWDSEKGEFPKTFNSERSLGLRISGDRSKVFNVNWQGSISRIQTWSMWTWVFVGEMELEVGKIYHLDCFHADGSDVWVQSGDLKTKGWDFQTPSPSLIPISNYPSRRPYLDFINGAFWRNGPSFVKDGVTGKEVFRLSGKYAKPHSVRWDGKYLVAGYRDAEVLILEFKDLYSE